MKIRVADRTAREDCPAGPIVITVLGPPTPYARTRIGAATGRMFTPTKQRNAMAVLRLASEQEMRGAPPIDCAIAVEIVAAFPIPISWSKRKQLSALSNAVMPTKRPDLSNLAKLVEDALNGVVFRDDALIVRLSAHKVYSSTPRTTITVTPLCAAPESRA